MVEGFLAGTIFGIAVGLLIARLWRRPVATPPGISASNVSSPSAPSPITQNHDEHGLHLRREVIHKTTARLTPEGISVTIDGQEFHRLEDIPDQAVADRMRALLASTATSTTDPALRAKVEEELRDAGIEPESSDPA